MHPYKKVNLFMAMLLTAFVLIAVVPQECSAASDSLKVNHAATIQSADSLKMPQSSNRPDMDSYVLRVFWVGLILVVFMLLALNWLKRRQGRGKNFGQNRIRILARHYLGPKQWIMIVRIDQKKYILGATEQNISLIADLGEITREEEIESGEPASISFGNILDRFKKDPSLKDN
ncbi:MAG TPA: flagellar biosynthetic protein FliO [Caldithrix abyssi]|uniref:Flagellar protein n=1 Tax=Caldithrix abyssi TaxID=187145 RepID=A0A7V4TZA7_CALAY|nr:flagellar biosynthetic protein FliO [Caldithrix abyssi]